MRVIRNAHILAVPALIDQAGERHFEIARTLFAGAVAEERDELTGITYLVFASRRAFLAARSDLAALDTLRWLGAIPRAWVKVPRRKDRARLALARAAF